MKEQKSPVELPQWLKDIEGQVRQFREFQSIENDLDSFIHVDPLKETTAHMAVRLEIENSISKRKDYLAEWIALKVVNHFQELGILE